MKKNELYNSFKTLHLCSGAIQNKKKYTIRNKFIRKVIDTSGAGDGFNAAYVSNFIIHNDPALALKEASLLGSKIIMQKGAIVDVK